MQAKKLDEFLNLIVKDFYGDEEYIGTWFELLSQCTESYIRQKLEAVKMGQYFRIARAIGDIVYDLPNLKTITIEGLERYRGVGPKTARFFMLHSFKGAKCAVLDTHILKYLRDCGYDAPKSTPQNSNAYRKLEIRFLELWEKTNQGLSLAEFDLKIWKKYSQ